MKKLIGIFILVIVFGALFVAAFANGGIDAILAIVAGFILAAVLAYAMNLITGEGDE